MAPTQLIVGSRISERHRMFWSAKNRFDDFSGLPLSVQKKPRHENLLSKLPPELLQLIMAQLPDCYEIWKLRAVDRTLRWQALNHLFQQVDILDFASKSLLSSGRYAPRGNPTRIPSLFRERGLAYAHHLIARTNAFHPALFDDLFSTTFHRLASLDVSFNPLVTEELLQSLYDNGVRLEVLNAEGCSRITDGQALARATPFLRSLSLGATNISSLPPFPLDFVLEDDGDEPVVQVWPRLIYLSIRQCGQLGRHALVRFLSRGVPTSVVHLDLRDLSRRLDVAALSDLLVTQPSPDVPSTAEPTSLRSLDVRGMHDVTRKDLQDLAGIWCRKRRQRHPIRVTHDEPIFEEHSHSAYLSYIRAASAASVVFSY